MISTSVKSGSVFYGWRKDGWRWTVIGRSFAEVVQWLGVRKEDRKSKNMKYLGLGHYCEGNFLAKLYLPVMGL